MARTLDTLPARKGGSRKAKYPYAEWFDGTVHVILKGEDYTAKTDSVKSSLSGEANKRGLSLHVRSLDSIANDKGQTVRQLLKLGKDADGFVFQSATRNGDSAD